MRLFGWVSGVVLACGLGGGCGPASSIEPGVPKDTGYVPAPPVMGPGANFKSFAKSPKQVKASPSPAAETGQAK